MKFRKERYEKVCCVICALEIFVKIGWPADVLKLKYKKAKWYREKGRLIVC